MCVKAISWFVFSKQFHSYAFNMKRSSSWKNLQKTFASTPNTLAKRPKFTRTKVNKENFSKQSSDECIDVQIEDSEEENVPNDTASGTATSTAPATAKTPVTPFQRINRARRRPKPLQINTSLNSTNVNESASFVCNSDSDESNVCGEPELRDVSELCASDERRCKARSKSLLFLAQRTKTPLKSGNCTNYRITSTDVSSSIHQNKRKTQKSCSPPNRNEMNDTTTTPTTCDGDDDDAGDAGTKIQLDSSSSEMDTPTKCTSHSDAIKARLIHSASDIVYTQTTGENSTNPAIESESSQFSFKISTSPAMPMPPHKRPKSRKHIKGGLVEQLNKKISRTKSEYSFWMNERTTNLIEVGAKMRIDNIEHMYQRILLHCTHTNAAPESIANDMVHTLCIDPSFKKIHELKVGKIIEIDSDHSGHMVSDRAMFYPNVTKILV